ncbi:metal-dependent hydrolase [Agromyces sp. LHK192]|uniref:metal-dependent hydrolase n=1 Tax=Agromyces sp. LHK192 TaxID=2498704 RepID=UPI000FD8ABBA|nr:metal-dependent hydrolase [Agromyces sp. LHK192]
MVSGIPVADTRVTYPTGEVHAHARVVAVVPVAASGESGAEHVAVVTDVTSIHPVDASWPDQPADRGGLRTADGTALPFVDAVVAATDGAELHLGGDIPVRKGTEGWAFVVAHLIDSADAARVAVGDDVDLEADAAYRRALSVGHTACHLASLALNRALADRWSKDARPDALGAPDFDGAAIESSRIAPDGSVDRFRLNKSLRRAGFDTASLVDASDADLAALAALVNATLATWTGSGAAIRIDRDGEGLTDRRRWIAELPDGVASIPCGGTHVGSADDLGEVRVSFERVDDGGTPVLVMTTSAAPRG